MTEKTIELRCLMSARDSPTAFKLRYLVREQMLAYIQERCPESLPKTRLVVEKEKQKYPCRFYVRYQNPKLDFI